MHFIEKGRSRGHDTEELKPCPFAVLPRNSRECFAFTPENEERCEEIREEISGRPGGFRSHLAVVAGAKAE